MRLFESWLIPMRLAHAIFERASKVPASGALREPGTGELRWSAANRVRLDLTTMALREFSSAQGTPTLICCPFALHDASVADLAPDHSVIQQLMKCGVPRILATEWHSAQPNMSHFGIDQYLADLNVAVDDLGPINLVGLCQGGWMALLFAARFPRKVRKLVLVGAPVDLKAAHSRLSRMAGACPMEFFENIVRSGHGLVFGEAVLNDWAQSLSSQDAEHILELPDDLKGAVRNGILTRFDEWNRHTVDLPGTYYLQVVKWLYKENRLAEGRFQALGRTIDLKFIRAPIFLMAGRDDQVVAPGQLLAAAHLVGTAPDDIVCATAPCSHLGLFMGRKILESYWRRIADWLTAPDSDGQETWISS